MDKRYRLRYDFVAQDPAELSCKVGEFVSSSVVPKDGWLKVKKSVGGAGGVNKTLEGLVPVDFLVEEVTPSAPPLPTSAHRPPPVAPVIVAPPNVAVDHAECPICYDELATRKCAVLRQQSGKRSCRHYLHLDCAQSLISGNRKTCPVCRAPFFSAYAVPDYDTNPKMWFDCVDADSSQTLSKSEVLDVLKALFLIDYKALEKSVDSLWPRWDKDRSGELDFSELCDPKTGLLVYVKVHFAREKQQPPPQLTMSNREEWFQYFDDDDGGTLDKEEIVRALVKTFRLSTDLRKVNEIRTVLDNVWSIFDTDGSGEIELEEFVQRDGLGETVIASLATI